MPFFALAGEARFNAFSSRDPGSGGEIPEVKVQGKHSRSQRAKRVVEEGSIHSITSACVVMISTILIGAVVVDTAEVTARSFLAFLAVQFWIISSP